MCTPGHFQKEGPTVAVSPFFWKLILSFLWLCLILFSTNGAVATNWWGAGPGAGKGLQNLENGRKVLLGLSLGSDARSGGLESLLLS